MKISVYKAWVSTCAMVMATIVAVLIGGGCSPTPATLADPTAPKPGYQRHIMLVLERPNFSPIAGAQVSIAVEAPTKLISPASGQGRTNSKGGLELIFAPLPHYDETVALGGDVVADFPIVAKLTVKRAGRAPVILDFRDKETFARYADPIYRGLSRDPKAEITYYNLVLP